MDWTDYVVCKHGAVFSDGVILEPGSIVIFNGSVWGSWISLLVKDSIDGELKSVTSKHDDEYDLMIRKGILIPAINVIKPPTEALFSIGDLVESSLGDNGIISMVGYSHRRKEWLYKVAYIDGVQADYRNPDEVIGYKLRQFIDNYNFSESEFRRVESLTDKIELNDTLYIVEYKEEK